MARLCRLKRPSCLAVAIEVCYQNTAIPLAVILNSFSDDPKYCGEHIGEEEKCDAVGLALGVPTYYQMVQIFSLAVCCLLCWKGGWTLAPKDESFFNVIGKNHQVEEKEEEEEEEDAVEEEGEGEEGEEGENATTNVTDNDEENLYLLMWRRIISLVDAAFEGKRGGSDFLTMTKGCW